jgi:hypothetical protein
MDVFQVQQSVFPAKAGIQIMKKLLRDGNDVGSRNLLSVQIPTGWHKKPGFRLSPE